MKFIDLHCDTITRLVNRKKNFHEADGLHVNLPGLVSSGTVAQVFACFVPGFDAPEYVFENCNRYIDAIESLTATYSDRLVAVTDSERLGHVVSSGDKTAVIIAIEGATPLKGDPDLLAHFYNRGVRVLTIAWDDNEFCGTVFGSQTGLTARGKDLVHQCNELGVIIDVSHASDKAFFDIAGITPAAFAATHSNARHICPNDRNLTDDMIRVIADRGGIIGLTYGSGFISPEYYQHEKKNRDRILKGLRDGSITREDANRISHDALSRLEAAELPQLVMHARHIMDVGGEACLGLGSDFDGVDGLVREVTGVASVPRIVDEMQRQGVPSRVIDKVCFQNALAFFQQMI